MAKRRKLKKSIKFFFFLILFILVLGAAYFYYDNFYLDKNTTKTKEVKKEKKVLKETWPKVSKISLVATGDGLLHNAVYYDAYNASADTFDFHPQLEFVKDEIAKYDLAYYNQESVFGGRRTERFHAEYQVPGYDSYPLFNSPSEFGDAMVDIGFNLVSLASNHSADCTWASKTCLENSYNYWKTKGVVFDGFNGDTTKTNNYNIGEVNGIKYGFLNYTNTLNGLDSNLNGIEYLIDTYDEATVKKEVEELKSKVDVIIVAMHWHYASSEYSTTPTESNKAIANYLSSLGVNIILGTYSHCLQPFDIIGENNTVVFYSLGNFISNQGDIISAVGYKGIVGILASMDITKTEYEDGSKEIKVDNIGGDLTYTYNNNHHNYRVIPFSKMTSEYNKDYQSIYDEYYNVVTALNNNITIKPYNK